MRDFNPMQSSGYNSLLNPEENRSVVRSCLRFFFNNKRFISSWVLYTLLLLSGFFACFLMGTINLAAPRLLDIIGSHNWIYQLAQQSPLLFSCTCFSISVLCWYNFYYTNFAIIHTLMQRLQNKPCNISRGFSQASNHKWLVLQWAFFAMAAQQAITMTQQSSSTYGRRSIIHSILSCNWILASFANFFAVPIMIQQNVGAWRALRISAHTLRGDFGRIIRLGLPFYAIHFLISLLIAGFLYLNQLHPQSPIFQYINMPQGMVILVALLLLWGTTYKAIQIIASTMLYLQYFDNQAATPTNKAIPEAHINTAQETNNQQSVMRKQAPYKME